MTERTRRARGRHKIVPTDAESSVSYVSDDMPDLPIVQIMGILASTPSTITSLFRLAETCKRMHALASSPDVWANIDVGALCNDFEWDEARTNAIAGQFGDKLRACREFSHVRHSFRMWLPHVCRMANLRTLHMTIDFAATSLGADLLAIARACPNLHTILLDIHVTAIGAVELPPAVFANAREVNLSCHPAVCAACVRAFKAPERLAINLSAPADAETADAILAAVRGHAPAIRELDIPAFTAAQKLGIVRACPNMRTWLVDMADMEELAVAPPPPQALTIILYGDPTRQMRDASSRLVKAWPGITWVHVIPRVVLLATPRGTLDEVVVLHVGRIQMEATARIHQSFPNLRHLVVTVAKLKGDDVLRLTAALLAGMAPPTTGAAFDVVGQQLCVHCQRSEVPFDRVSWIGLCRTVTDGVGIRTVFIDYAQ